MPFVTHTTTTTTTTTIAPPLDFIGTAKRQPRCGWHALTSPSSKRGWGGGWPHKIMMACASASTGTGAGYALVVGTCGYAQCGVRASRSWQCRPLGSLGRGPPGFPQIRRGGGCCSRACRTKYKQETGASASHEIPFNDQVSGLHTDAVMRLMRLQYPQRPSHPSWSPRAPSQRERESAVPSA
jgi:hypothetical protein